MVSPGGGTADWGQGGGITGHVLVSFGVAFSFEMPGLIMGLVGVCVFFFCFFGFFN